MSKESIIAEFEKEQEERDRKYEEEQAALRNQLELMHRNAQTMTQYAREVILLNKNMDRILREDMEYETPDHIKMTIGGAYNVKGADGQTVIKYGTLDVFRSPEFEGKPFYEVSRNMFSHFRIYCLTKGMTEEELLQMATENPPEELVSKIRGMKKGFFDMVTSFDNPAAGENNRQGVIDFYVGLCKMTIEKGDALLKLGDAREGAEAVHMAALMFSGADSFVSQTLKVGDTNEPELTKEIDKAVREKMGKQEMGLHDLWAAISPLEAVMNGLTKKDEVQEENISDKQVLFGQTLLSQTFANLSGAILQTRANNKNTDVNETAGERIRKASEDMEETARFYSLISQHQGQDILKETFPAGEKHTGELKFEYDFNAAESLYTEMRGNVRKGIFGRVKDNSKEYDDIMKCLDDLRKAEKAAGKKDAALETYTKEAKKIRSCVIALQKAARVYLEEKNPSSRDGIARYKMALRAQLLAERQVRDLNALEKTMKQAAADANAVNPALAGEIKQRDISFMERAEATDKNEKLSADEKELEQKISSNLYNICMILSKNSSKNPDRTFTDAAKEELIRVMADLCANATQRARQAYKNDIDPLSGKKMQPLTAEQMRKLAAGYIREGVAERMLSILPEKQTDIAKMTAEDLYRKVSVCAKQAKEEREQAEKAEADQRVAETAENHRQAAEFKNYCSGAISPEFWGFTQEVLDELKKEITTNLSVSRTVLQSLALGVMITAENPSYTIDQALGDPYLAPQREEAGRKALTMLRNADHVGIANTLFKGGRKLADYVNDRMKRMPEITLAEFKKPENWITAAAGRFLYDYFQEFRNAKKNVPEGTKMEYDKKTADQLDNDTNVLGNLMTSITNGSFSFGQNPTTSEVNSAMVYYMKGSFTAAAKNELIKRNKGKELWDEGDLLTYRSNLNNEQMEWPETVYAGLGKLIHNPKYTRAFAESLQDDTLIKDMKLRVKFDENGAPHMTINLKSLEKKLNARYEAQLRADGSADAPVAGNVLSALKK